MLSRSTLRQSWRAWYSFNEPMAGPVWLHFIWTGLFCLAVALGFAVLGLAIVSPAGTRWWAPQPLLQWYVSNLVITLCVGYSIHLLFIAAAALAGRERLGALTGWRAVLLNVGIPLAGTAIGWPLGVMWALGVDLREWMPANPRMLAGSLLLSLLLCVLFYVFFDLKTRQIEAERRASQAQLKLLQGQMEPHFLFNTLANVLSLMETDPARARGMLESFVDYLRASLDGLRGARRTLGDEIDLVQAYLGIAGVRMEGRLRVTLEVPDELRKLPLPSLLLQPLVENAIQHGLEPSIDGGHLQLRVRADGHDLLLTVEDDGLGPHGAAPPGARQGNGTALATLRERLARAYGDRAQLQVEPGRLRGTRVALRLPLPAAA